MSANAKLIAQLRADYYGHDPSRILLAIAAIERLGRELAEARQVASAALDYADHDIMCHFRRSGYTAGKRCDCGLAACLDRISGWERIGPKT